MVTCAGKGFGAVALGPAQGRTSKGKITVYKAMEIAMPDLAASRAAERRRAVPQALPA